ncbi:MULTISPECIES: hypothetical protein [unclassified Micromonospora]|uniref:hypothetical protein n=1 Tax=unclassified Micromonospora TaxID=2617518 RepID=UPI00331E4DE8
MTNQTTDPLAGSLHQAATSGGGLGFNTGPTLFAADWHARRAEDLADRALSASMSGWWKRGRRREMLAAAQVHATLGAIAMRAERAPR